MSSLFEICKKLAKRKAELARATTARSSVIEAIIVDVREFIVAGRKRLLFIPTSGAYVEREANGDPIIVAKSYNIDDIVAGKLPEKILPVKAKLYVSYANVIDLEVLDTYEEEEGIGRLLKDLIDAAGEDIFVPGTVAKRYEMFVVMTDTGHMYTVSETITQCSRLMQLWKEHLGDQTRAFIILGSDTKFSPFTLSIRNVRRRPLSWFLLIPEEFVNRVLSQAKEKPEEEKGETG